ncbi:MAG: ABC transporter permease [Promethearchaeota archaeon]
MPISKTEKIPSIIKYIIKRILITIPLFIGVVGLVWYLCNFIPGIPNQYRYLAPDQEVWYLLRHYIPQTMEIAFIPLIFINIFAVKLGKYAVSHRGQKSDSFLRMGTLMAVSLPVFWVALIIQHLFTVPIPSWTFGIINLPAVGLYSVKNAAIKFPFITGFRTVDTLLSNQLTLFMDTLLHLIVPSSIFFIIYIGRLARIARSCMLDVIEEDYIRTARAKGCSEKNVLNKHVFRNTIVTYSTFFGLNASEILSGAIYIEIIFDIRGLGAAMIYAIQNTDYFMIRGCVIVFCFIYFILNLIVDILYSIFDPRIIYY